MLSFRLAAADLIIGAVCAGCGRPALSVCDECADALIPEPRPAWPHPAPRAFAMNPRVEPVASGSYEGPLRSVLAQFKEEGQFGLLGILSYSLAAAVGAGAPAGPIVLVPIPSTSMTRMRRGHDVIAELARAAATSLRGIGIDCTVALVLSHARKVADQSGLSAQQRSANMNGALRVRSGARMRGRRVVIVDDILTTGATAAEAVRALTVRGFRPVCVAVVAATPRRPEGISAHSEQSWKKAVRGATVIDT